jgi:Ca2+-binding RTX toxin-like protein
MTTITALNGVPLNTDQTDISDLLSGLITSETSTRVVVVYDGGFQDVYQGTGFTFDSLGNPIGGTISSITSSQNGIVYSSITNLNMPVSVFMGFVYAQNDEGARQYFLSGADIFNGGDNVDLIRGYDGPDSISGGFGTDSLDGGAGNDTISGGSSNDIIIDASGSNYLRGDDGNDIIRGGADFDDINGNAGNDTAAGGQGDDWVVGGKDNDSLSGEAGADIVYGNLGNDTNDGGSGDDIIRGGQGDDVLFGGTGNDWISGDRGNDTLTGGTGADTFNTFGDAGTDRVLDFSRADGDRVRLDPGSTYTVSQVGSDTVINVTGGAQLILVGVSQSSLTGDWIFVG